MEINNYKDIYIRYVGHPKFSPSIVVEDDLMNVLIQKLEMILFTAKGDVLGNPDMGCNLEYYLWQTKVPAKQIKKVINDQIAEYIPEMLQTDYDISLELYEGTVQDIMIITITIKDTVVDFVFQ